MSAGAWASMLAGVAGLLGVAFFTTERAGDNERQRVQQMVEGFVPTYAQALSELGYERLELTTPADDPLYLALIETTKRWLAVNPAVADIYTFEKRADGRTVLMLDSETDYDRNGVYEGEREARTAIGEVYQEPAGTLDAVLAGKGFFSDEIYTDRWGTWVSAYEPIRDSAGRVIAVCGVDFPADQWLAAIQRARLAALAQIAVIQTILMAAAVWVSRARTESAARKRISDDLSAALSRAEFADRAKSEFLASMSHEIRTPMNGVIGMSELLQDTELNARQRQFADTIMNSAKSLLGVINDILDFSHGQSGRIVLETIPADLRETLEDVVALLAVQAHRKGIELTCLISESVPPLIYFDPLRVRQVVTNLVGNALKFTERGQVSVEVRCAERDGLEADCVEVECSVTDTGIGIDSDKLERVFEPFTQADGTTARRYGGTGLGLAITKQLVSLMSGTLGADSTVGKGSRFWFRLPLKLSLSSPTDRHDPTELAGLRVLVVDDHETNRRIVLHHLAAWGMNGHEAEHGQDALRQLRSAAERGLPYQMAVLDVAMPGMDGSALVRAIKEDGTIPALPLIMLITVDGLRNEERPPGAKTYLTKPIKRSALLACLLEAWIGADATGETAHSVQRGMERALVSPRILLVEDNAVNQRIAMAFLGMIGCDVDLAEDGGAAVEAVRKGAYDLVLMDGELPDMDGMDATRSIRAHELSLGLPNAGPTRERMPIIALTAHAMHGDRERFIASGMDDYLSKPFTREQLSAMLCLWLPWAFVSTTVATRAPS